ncbi:MAG: T9SS type A sorting domain-containing protein [candidate division WOR-3 bacterium]|nr:T9SS type A sorting domain-containing protein [candidate division WOR-3 bacterium]
MKEIKIFDISGKLVKEIATPSARNDNSLRVSLYGIKNGIYFVKINNSNQVTKIIVTK